MDADFEQIEDQIVTTLKTNLPYVRTVETYAGQLDGKIEELPIYYPAIFVIYSGGQFEWVDGQQLYKEEDIFTLMAASKNITGNTSMRKDTAIGCYKIIKDVLKHITGKNFGLDIERMQPIDVKMFLITKTIAVYEINFKTNFDKVY